jgi:hypothetical protein
MSKMLLMLALTSALQTESSMRAVLAAAAREPVEAFGTGPGAAVVGEAQWLDVDSDGRPEAFVRITPSFRQTPTILVYTYSQQNGAQRLLEGLAPGRLRAVSGRLKDSHATGDGLDLVAGNPTTPQDVDKLLGAFVPNGMSLVRYRTFLHGDVRKGFVGYVDLSDRALPSSATNTCADVEFSMVESLAAGTLAGASGMFLAALTREDVTLYRFRAIRPNGLLDKQVWVVPRPVGTRSLSVSPGGAIQFVNAAGVTPVPAPR